MKKCSVPGYLWYGLIKPLIFPVVWFGCFSLMVYLVLRYLAPQQDNIGCVIAGLFGGFAFGILAMIIISGFAEHYEQWIRNCKREENIGGGEHE